MAKLSSVQKNLFRQKLINYSKFLDNVNNIVSKDDGSNGGLSALPTIQFAMGSFCLWTCCISYEISRQVTLVDGYFFLISRDNLPVPDPMSKILDLSCLISSSRFNSRLLTSIWMKDCES